MLKLGSGSALAHYSNCDIALDFRSDILTFDLRTYVGLYTLHPMPYTLIYCPGITRYCSSFPSGIV